MLTSIEKAYGDGYMAGYDAAFKDAYEKAKREVDQERYEEGYTAGYQRKAEVDDMPFKGLWLSAKEQRVEWYERWDEADDRVRELEAKLKDKSIFHRLIRRLKGGVIVKEAPPE